MQKLIFTLLLFTAFTICKSQTQFWSDTFEDTGAPSSGTRTPSTTFYASNERYFDRVTLAQVNTTNVYTAFEGSKFFGAADVDNLTGQNTQSRQQTVTWSSINISGKTGLSFKGLFAIGNPNNFDHFPGASPIDYMLVEYRIDGGAWTNAIRFFPNIANSGSGALALETTGDSLAAGEGAALTGTFTEFSYSIPSSGTLLDLRLKCGINGTSFEEIAVDNFRLFETVGCTNPTVGTQPTNKSVCFNSNTSFSIAATGASSYQWQENSGSGFTNITNGGIYSGATTAVLNLTGVTSQSGYLYRCIALGTGTCQTISNSATLTVSAYFNTSSQTNVSCNGGSNGSATLNAAGGISPYTYSWAPSGGTGATATGLSAGTYTVTVTDAISCSTTKTFTITQPTALVVNPLSQTNIACFSGSNGAASINTPSGGAGGYTYNWTPGNPTGDGTTSVTGLTAGTWSCTVTDANSCTRTQTFNITQPASALSASNVVTNVLCFGASTGAINLTPAGGTTAYTFNWGGGITTEDRTGLLAGAYTCTITDANGCTTTSNATVTQPASALATATAVTNVLCFGNSTGSATVTASGGTGSYTYLWSSAQTTSVITGLNAGVRTVTVTDANGCTSSKSINISQPASALSASNVVTNVSCFGGSNGAINLTPTGGTTAYTFNWGGGVTTEDRTGLLAGAYTCTITDANGCTTTSNATITQPASALSASNVVTNVSCFGGSNGAINLTPAGGTTAYTFNWGGGITTEDRTGLLAGAYTCTITDANGCTAFQAFNITQPASALATATAVTNVACFGNSTGAATITASGGTSSYSYLWSTGATTSVIASQTSGVKTVTVTDANGCTSVKSVSISQPASALATSTTISNVLCNGGSTGSATVTTTGGTSAYSYLWSTGATTSVITSQTSGVKTVTVTDANGCTSVNSVNISQPTILTATTSQTNTTCNGVCNGAANVSVSGGTSPYTYNWSNGSTTASQNGLCAGSYSATITDANGCSIIQTITITEPTAITISNTSGNILCNGGSTTVTVTANGGTGAYTGTGAFTQTAGTYTYTVSDANACSTSTVITISEPTVLTINLSAAPIACNGSTTQVNIVANGGTSPYTGTTPAVVSAGSYSYTVTDDNGCAVTETISISEPAAIVASQTITLCNGQSLSIGANTYTASGIYVDVLPSQINGCDSTLTTDLTISSAITHTQNINLCFGETINVGANTYNTSGTYVDILTAINGCDSTLTTILVVNPAIDVTTNLSGLTISANESSATYQWIDCDNSNQPIAGETNQSFTASSNGNYAVIVTQNACSDTSACVNISTVGIKDMSKLNTVSIYPNPSNGIYNISGVQLNTHINIYNSVGELIESTVVSSSITSINLSNYSNGLYVIKFKNNNGEMVQKLIKQQ